MTEMNLVDLPKYVEQMKVAKKVIDDQPKNLPVDIRLIEEFRQPIYDWVYSHYDHDTYFDEFDEEGSGGVFASPYARRLLDEVFEDGYDGFQRYLADLYRR